MNEKLIQRTFRKNGIAISRQIFLVFLSFSLFSISLNAQGQNKRVNGTVVSTTGEPLIGVVVGVEGTTNATITDLDGKFELQVSPTAKDLAVSFIGMIKKTVPIGSGVNLWIELEDDTVILDEVVAVGYGNMRKKDLSGSITNVTDKDFNKGVVTSAEQLIKGHVAGLVITQPGGDPTQDVTMRLRGSTSLVGGNAPLVVIDGVPGVSMNSVAPQDIESISVLKDASAAAIYGARSANGVIMITTKRGKEGQSSVSYNGFYAVENTSNRLDLLTADQWRQWVKEYDTGNKARDFGSSTDWQDEVYRTGYSQNHNLSLTGGTSTSNYRASINFLDRKGVIRTSELQRLTGNVAIEQTALDGKLKFSVNLNGTVEDYTKIPVDIFSYIPNMNPTMPVYNDDGSFYETDGHLVYNPVAALKETTSENKRTIFLGRMQVDYKFLDMFTASVNGSMNRSNLTNGYYESRKSRTAGPGGGFARRESSLDDSKLFESMLALDKTFGMHKINAVMGYSYQEFMSEYMRAQNRKFDTDAFGYNNLGAGNDFRAGDVASNKNSSKLISFYGRANYVFAGKYIATATIRRDGSSKFGDNRKWGTFPSASVAWRITEENFMKDVSFADDLKMRVSYGITGNEAIGNYKSRPLYGTAGYFYDDGNYYLQYTPTQNHNPNLKWEQTAQFDVGLDYFLFNGKLRGSIDYYVKTTSDLLYEYRVPTPPYHYDRMMANVGKVENRGIEISLESTIIDRRNFKWNMGLNFAKNKNMIKSLSNDQFNFDYILLEEWALNGIKEPPIILQAGHPMGTFYGAKYIGKDENGIFQYQDANGNKTFLPKEEDKTYIGDAQPDFTLNMTNSFDYKNFSLSFMLRGVFGHDIVNSTAIYLDDISRMPSGNVLESALDKAKQDVVYSSYYVEDGSFVRLEYLTLGYDFKLSPKSKIKNLRLSATANNLFVITGYSGLDPEVKSDMQPGVTPARLPGIDARNYYPKTRSFSLGLNISF